MRNPNPIQYMRCRRFKIHSHQARLSAIHANSSPWSPERLAHACKTSASTRYAYSKHFTTAPSPSPPLPFSSPPTVVRRI